MANQLCKYKPFLPNHCQNLSDGVTAYWNRISNAKARIPSTPHYTSVFSGIYIPGRGGDGIYLQGTPTFRKICYRATGRKIIHIFGELSMKNKAVIVD
jgi:hypothetical protein